METATQAPSRRPTERARPFLFSQFCKSCGRCIEACPKGCIELADAIDPATGLRPVQVDAEACNACGLCVAACPEPFGLMPEPEPAAGDPFDATVDPESLFGRRPSDAPIPVPIADRRVDLAPRPPLASKGTHAAAVGALLAGCRHFFGYPITPSTEGAELMARVLPELDGTFVQAVSEVATVNMMYGCGGAGLRSMTFTSSPGLSLMLEGISYMIGAEVPGVFVDVMRGGPGLGNIGPEQSDIKLMCRGLGHGNTHALVLAPSTPQEMLDLTYEAFDLAFRYRNPVMIAADGYLGQMTGQVTLPRQMVRPGLPAWAVWGDRGHRRNLIASIQLAESDLEAHNERLNAKYRRISRREQRAEAYRTDDARWLLVSCNTPARMARGAVEELRAGGVAAGLLRPVSLWPFPVDALAEALPGVEGLLMVEAGPGQLEDEMRLAAHHAGLSLPPIHSLRRLGGVLPQVPEIVDAVRRLDLPRRTS